MKIDLKYRQFLPESRRVVVKIGTRVIAQRTGRPDMDQLHGLVSQIAALRRAGTEMVVVTSGAVGAGMEALGIRDRPTVVSDLQMCAAVGQARLMAYYTKLFMNYKIRIGQILLTHDDFKHRVRNANAKRTLEHLLRAGVVPIINENDVVADEELKAEFSFGDNDYLAALVVKLIRADLLVILSTVDGVLRINGKSRRRIPCIDKLGPDIYKLVSPGANALSKGGMDSKLRSAQIATKAGCSVVIGNGRKKNTLTDILAGRDVGTLILGSTL
jgi:glutamate 5-kinase